MTLVIEQNNLNTKFSVISQNSLQSIEDSQQNLKNTDTLTSYSVDSRNIITNLNSSFSSEELNSYNENVDVSNSLNLTNSFIVDLIEDLTVSSLNTLTNQEIFIVTQDVIPFDIRAYNPDLNVVETKSIERLIKTSQDAIDKISILSHENLTVSKSKSTLDTNLLYLSAESIVDESFKNINRTKYNKFESISDRLFNYVNIEKYELLLKRSLKRAAIL